MWRHRTHPRAGWQDIVTRQGLVFPETDREDGSKTPYWNEHAWYEFTMAEVEALEGATEELWGMSLDAVRKMSVDFDDKRLGLPQGSMRLISESMDRLDPSVYGRFDLRYVDETGGTGVGSIKMLELNGDTPTGLVETGVAQWRWLEDTMPLADQWNSLHDRLVDQWRLLREQGAFPEDTVHFLYTPDPSGEEEMTVFYMQDLATQAGLRTRHHPITDVGWDDDAMGFVDVDGLPIRSAFKLYPWESLLAEEYARALTEHMEDQPVRWVEPLWKVLMSTKAILPVLWEMNPGHPLLLPATFDAPSEDMLEWIAKPLQGREGDNITVHRITGDETTNPGGYGAEGFVYQEYAELPTFEGNYAMLGSWIVGDEAAGMLVRESDGPVTDYYSRVCPHIITDGLADEEQRAAWLAERTGAKVAERFAKAGA